MKLHALQGVRGRVIDLDTGRPVPKVIWLDEELGLIKAYTEAPDGSILRDINGNYRTYQARGRFRLVPLHHRDYASLHTSDHRRVDASSVPPSPGRRVVMGAPACARCRSPLTLPGDDLCPSCRAADRGQRNRMLVERMSTPLLDRPCEVRGCGRLATWAVSDEVEVTPSAGSIALGSLTRRVMFERGCTVGRRWYCSWHWLPPRILDARGEVVERLDEAGGVRPE